MAQPRSAREALAVVQSGLRYLATADAAALTVAEQADCLRGLAVAEAVQLAARSSVLHAFTAADGYAADGQMTPRAWLRWQTQSTSAAAAAAAAWSRRLAAHAQVAAALQTGDISPSYAREICDWTDRLPEESRSDADRILLDAAAGGAGLGDLSGLAQEIYRRCAPPDSDDGDDRFAQRWLRLTPHYRGHARIDGDLTPRAAAALRAVLDALGKKRGSEDDRTTAQREHDALEEACVRIVGAGLPDRAGQPTQIQLAMPLQQLTGLPDAAAAAISWTGQPDVGATAYNWTGHLPPAPPGAECDASIVPMVTGHLDADVLGRLAARLLSGPGTGNGTGLGTGPGTVSHPGSDVGRGACVGTGADSAVAASRPESDADIGRGVDADGEFDVMAVRVARQLTIAEALRLLSGPPGLVSYLRRSQLSGPAASVSLPLDVGAVTETIPPHLRRAVILRAGGHCEAPGCDRGEAWCHVHHIIPRSAGGPTSLENSFLGCDFHHLIMIHRWGWKIFLNPDGTTTMVSPDGTKTLRSHAPPNAA